MSRPAKARQPSALERLRQAGELTLVRSYWCEPEQGSPGEWRSVLCATQGLALVRQGLATMRGSKLRPVQGRRGGE